MRIGQAVYWYKYKRGMTHAPPEIIPAVVRCVQPSGRVAIEISKPVVRLRYVLVENLRSA